MNIASDLTGALDPVLVAAGFAAGQGGKGTVDGEPVGITYCAGHDDLSDRFPWLPQADEYPRGTRACTDLVIEVSPSGVVERIDFEAFTLVETLVQVGHTEDARTAAGLVGRNVGEALGVLPGILERLFRNRADKRVPIVDEIPDPDGEIRSIRIAQDEYQGPFWEGDWSVGDDFDDLHRRLGISRPLFDDIMEWNDDDGDWYERIALLERLRSEVPSHIEVLMSRPHPPRRVSLLLLRVEHGDAGRELVELRPDGVRADPLPPTPHELIDDFLAWRADHVRMETLPEAVIDANPTEYHEVQDRGWELGKGLATAWGPDFVCEAFPP